MKIKPKNEIFSLCEKVASPLGIEVVEIEFKQGKNPSLTVYIDKEGGVDLDSCEKFHRAVDLPLDELDPTYGAPYTLNVSSLGVDRPFRTEKDFLSHIGEMVEIKLYSSIKGKKQFDGVLCSYTPEAITVRVNDKDTFTIDIKNIVKINEYIDFE